MERIRSGCLEAVRRYQARHVDHASRGCCRFTPTCSAYALEVLAKRSLPVALLAIGWRIIRCNPLVRVGTADPVRRSRPRLRPNSLRTASIATLLGGLVVVLAATSAFGQGVSGGCSGTVGGSPPSALTSDAPLVVGKGETVELAGRSPRSGGQTVVDYSIALIAGIVEVDDRAELHGAGKRWTGTVNVDDYLDRGSGLYLIEGEVTTTDGAYSCPVSFYVKLDGNKVIGIAGAGVALLGGLGVRGAARAKPPTAAEWSGRAEPSSSASADADGVTTKEMGEWFSGEVDKMTKPKPDTAANATADGGCLVASLVAFVLGDEGWEMLVSSVAAAPSGRSGRLWSKGRTGLGFFSGLIFGLGGTVAAQQFGVWTLNPVTLIGLPLLMAFAGAVRARKGTAYKAG